MNWYSKVEQFRRDSIPPNYFNKLYKPSQRIEGDVSPSKSSLWLKQLREGIQGRRLSKSPTRIFVQKVWRQPLRSKSFSRFTRKRLYKANDISYRRQSTYGDLFGIPSTKQKKINIQITNAFIAWQMYLREKERLEKRRKAIKLKTMEKLQYAEKKPKKQKDKGQRGLAIASPQNERASPSHRDQAKHKQHQQQTEIQMSEQAHQELLSLHQQNTNQTSKIQTLPSLIKPILTEQIKSPSVPCVVNPEPQPLPSTEQKVSQQIQKENQKQLSKFHPSRQSTLRNIFQLGRQSIRLRGKPIELPPLEENLSPMRNSIKISLKIAPQQKKVKEKSPQQLSSTRSLKIPQQISSQQKIKIKSKYGKDNDSNTDSPQRQQKLLSIQNIQWKINLIIWTDPKKLRILHGSVDDFNINYQYIEKPQTPNTRLIVNNPTGSEKKIQHNQVTQLATSHHHKITLSKHKFEYKESRMPSQEDAESRCESSDSFQNTVIHKKPRQNLKYKEILRDTKTLLEIMTQQSKLRSNRTMVNFIHRSPKSQLQTDVSKIEQNSIVTSSICQYKKLAASNSTRTLGSSIANSHYCSSQYLSRRKLQQDDNSNRLTLLELHSQYKTQEDLILSAVRRIKTIHSPEMSIKYGRSRIDTYL